MIGDPGSTFDVGPDHERFQYDNAAYVLSALEPAERREFEVHLAACARCRTLVDEAANVTKLLNRIEFDPASHPESAMPHQAGVVAFPTARADVLPILLNRVRADRRRRRLRTAAIGLAAACLVGGIGVATTSAVTRPHHPAQVAMQPLAAAPSDLTAKLSITDNSSGSRLRLTCLYRGIEPYSAGSTPPWYRMVVFNRAGQQVQLGTWPAVPYIEMNTDSPWPARAISRVEVETMTGIPVLSRSY
ncbi:MAG: hypothetical protein JWN95_2900 [Frankiales bacterium]|nr:hypothetical protein [Frankiales bacterium]